MKNADCIRLAAQIEGLYWIGWYEHIERVIMLSCVFRLFFIRTGITQLDILFFTCIETGGLSGEIFEIFVLCSFFQ